MDDLRLKYYGIYGIQAHASAQESYFSCMNYAYRKKKKTFLKNASGNNNKQDFVNSSKEMRKRIF